MKRIVTLMCTHNLNRIKNSARMENDQKNVKKLRWKVQIASYFIHFYTKYIGVWSDYMRYECDEYTNISLLILMKIFRPDFFHRSIADEIWEESRNFKSLAQFEVNLHCNWYRKRSGWTHVSNGGLNESCRSDKRAIPMTLHDCVSTISLSIKTPNRDKLTWLRTTKEL